MKIDDASLVFTVTGLYVDKDVYVDLAAIDKNNFWRFQVPHEELTMWAQRVGKRIRLLGKVEDL